MSDYDVNNTVMSWQPSMLRLTQIGCSGIDGGVPTTLYVNPASILMVCRTGGRLETKGVEPFERESCTAICIQGMGGSLLVTEAVETVALLRDRALGHKSVPQEVA